MSIERSIVEKLIESRNQKLLNYKGFSIEIDFDNIIHVKRGDREIGQFESTESATDYIDNMKAMEKVPPRIAKRRYVDKEYYIFLKGTHSSSSNRAKYLSRKTKKCEWCYERDADTYNKKERDAILRNSTHYDSYPV